MSNGRTDRADRSLLLRTAVVSDLLETQLEERLASVRFSPREFEIATVLSTRGPTAPGEIAMVTGVPAPSVSRMTAAMERAGLVRQREHPSDRRSRLVDLTPQGHTAFEEAEAAFQPLYDAVAAALGPTLSIAEMGVRHLERALRVVAGTDIPAPLSSGSTAHVLHYAGSRLDAVQEAEVMAYIEWIRARPPATAGRYHRSLE